MNNEILNNVADAVIDKPIVFTVDIVAQNMIHRYLLKIGWIKRKKGFEIRCVKMGTLIRISRLLLSIDLSFFNKEKIVEGNYLAIEKNAQKLAECIALAVHNRESPVPKKLVSFILANFSTAELYACLLLVIKQMDLSNFMNSIITIRGVNILANPTANIK